MEEPPLILACGSPLQTAYRDNLREVSGYPAQSCGVAGGPMFYEPPPENLAEKS